MIKLRARFGAITAECQPFNAAASFRFRAEKPRYLFTKMWMAASGLCVTIIGLSKS
jgi:hypothetical protein